MGSTSEHVNTVLTIIDTWVRVVNSPVPRKYIFQVTKKLGIHRQSIIYVLKVMEKELYFRKTWDSVPSKMLYVQIRTR